MAVFVLLSEFLPCRRDRDQDDEEPGPLPA